MSNSVIVQYMKGSRISKGRSYDSPFPALMTVDKVCNMADNIGRLLWAGKMREKIVMGGVGSESKCHTFGWMPTANRSNHQCSFQEHLSFLVIFKNAKTFKCLKCRDFVLQLQTLLLRLSKIK